MRAALLAASGLVLAAAWAVSRQVSAATVQDWQTSGGEAWPDAPVGDWLATADSVLQDAATTITGAVGAIIPAAWGLDVWHTSKIPVEYRAAIIAAEDANGIPRDMLARLLWQESRFRPEIISGAVTSSAGAQGIAQFMPATAAELKIDPLNPWQSIDAAGRYLRRLYNALGTWAQALAAYNWGIGNVRRKGLAAAPRETREYYVGILADVGMGTSIV